MVDYKKLADSIVAVLRSAHGKLQTADLKTALVEFQDLSDDDLNIALRQLFSDGVINAAYVSSGIDGIIGAFYSIELTPREHDTDDDRKFARLAIEEARKSVHEQDGRPHPRVGAVVVKNGQVLSSAHRGEAVGNHAEFIALEKKLPDSTVAGATVYTTLEPCTTRNHPKIPCAERLIERKVSRVVIGMLDPDPRITGRGQRRLRGANIITDFFPHDLMTEVEELNREFMRHHETQGQVPQPSPMRDERLEQLRQFASQNRMVLVDPVIPAQFENPFFHVREVNASTLVIQKSSSMQLVGI